MDVVIALLVMMGVLVIQMVKGDRDDKKTDIVYCESTLYRLGSLSIGYR